MWPGKAGFALAKQRAGQAIFTIFLLLYIVASRWATAPRYFFSFDQGNFALALEDFNPALNQPQPPGYPLFVGLIRLIHIWVQRPERVLLVAGLVAACLSAVLIQRLAAELFGRAAGILAMALLASNPVFWFGGVTNQVRLFLAVSALAVALLAWRALTQSSPNWFYGAFAGLGIAAGFRPVESLLLIPMLLWVWFRTGPSVKRLVLGVTAALFASLPWLAFTVVSVGGPSKALRVVSDYAGQQFGSTSALFGASESSALHMFAAAVVWNALGALVWVWAIPIAGRKVRDLISRTKTAFLAIWFFPPFLFSAFVHIGDPDQALASMPVICILGGAVMACVAARARRRSFVPIVAALIAAQTVLFFKAPTELARAASYNRVVEVERMISGVLRSINALRLDGPLTIVQYGSAMPWRLLEYYYPDDYTVAISGYPGHFLPGNPLLSYHRKYLDYQYLPNSLSGNLLMPKSHNVVCLLPAFSRLPGWLSFGSVSYKQIPDEHEVTIGPYRLTQDAQ